VVLVKADEATVRAEASPKGKSLDTFTQLTPVQVMGVEDKYTKVQVGDKTGYILTASLSNSSFASTKVSGDERVKVRATAAADALELMTLGSSHYPLRVLDRDGKRVKVVDCDGDGGWVYESYLSLDRYVIATPPAGQGDWINLRDKPGLDSSGKALGTKRFSAQKGTIFQVLEEQGGWLHVKYIADGDEGWCSANLVWGWNEK
jgi:SH3-like domain-containing protein